MPKVKIDKDLYERIKSYAEEAGYSSVDEFVIHAVEKEMQSGQEDDEQSVKDRLKGLGYI